MNMDWHKADINASLKKCGLSLAVLSRVSGLSYPTLANAPEAPEAPERSLPNGAHIIAKAIGIHPVVTCQVEIIRMDF